MRIGRLLRGTGALLSLMLFASLTLLWIQSYDKRLPTVLYAGSDSEGPRTLVAAQSGALFYERGRLSPAHRQLSPDWRFVGISYWRAPSAQGAVWQVGVPCWLLTSALALTTWALARGRRRAPAPNAIAMCAHCGYDLRATPSRCPECGRAVTPNR
jgi:hypothetical protein